MSQLQLTVTTRMSHAVTTRMSQLQLACCSYNSHATVTTRMSQLQLACHSYNSQLLPGAKWLGYGTKRLASDPTRISHVACRSYPSRSLRNSHVAGATRMSQFWATRSHKSHVAGSQAAVLENLQLACRNSQLSVQAFHNVIVCVNIILHVECNLLH